MATNHVAIMRSSARMAHQQQLQQLQKESEFLEDDSSADRRPGPSSSSNQDHNTYSTDLSNQLSVISISSSDGDDISHELSIRKSGSNKQQSKIVTKSKAIQIRPMMVSLGEITNVSHIDNSVDFELHEAVVIDRLLNKWHDISSNLDTVMSHLNECSNQVGRNLLTSLYR